MLSPAHMILPVAMILGRAAAFAGDMTYYYPGLGSCGSTNGNGDPVVALSPIEHAGNCGRSINIHYAGHTTSAVVVDTCPGCAPGSIDVSPVVFSQLSDPSAGRVQVTWEFA
ncbi:riboflavine-aldehyde-forming enzyme [Biscogniauxia sp. FL1348]|nr:riboflavine-aldehyde-forming enzyme [Biscogniauxia sp. FL1348]